MQTPWQSHRQYRKALEIKRRQLLWFLGTKSQIKSLQLKIGGKDKDGTVFFLSRTSFLPTNQQVFDKQCKMRMIGSQRRTKTFKRKKTRKVFVQIFIKMKMTEGKDKDLAVCFKKALFLFKILLHASPITSPPDGNSCGDFCDGWAWPCRMLLLRRLFWFFAITR